MKIDIKSGKEILDGFFCALSTDQSLDQETIETIVSLYGEGRLSDRNIVNALAELREPKLDDEDK